MEQEATDLGVICRTCKCVSPHMRSLYQSLENTASDPRIDEMLMACTAVQVAVGDGLPSLMCEMCVHQLKSAFTFKKQCEVVDVSLREYAKNAKVNAIKQELQNNDFMESLNTLSNLLNETSQALTTNKDVIGTTAVASQSISEVPEKDEGEKTATGPLPPETDYIQILDNNQMLLTCRECAKIFTTVDGLRCHKRLHAGTTLKCRHCEKEYTRITHLQRHEATHGKRKVHVCRICNKTLTRMEHLKRHLITHLREKPFNCKTCNRGFNRIEHLQNHSPRCKGDIVHICNICNKAFNREDSLEVHKQQHDKAQLSFATIDNLNNIEEHYFEVDYDENAKFSDQSDVDDCFEPEVEVMETEMKEFNDVPSRRDDSSSRESLGGAAAVADDGPHDRDSDEECEAKLDVEVDVDAAVAVGAAEIKEERDPTAAHGADADDEDFGVADADMEVGGQRESSDSSDEEYTPRKAPVKPAKRGRGRPRKNPFAPPKRKVPGRRRGRPPKNGVKREPEEEEVGEYPCPVCGQVFNRMSRLDRHARKDHPGDKIHKCPVCPKEFSRSNHLRRHVSSHSEDKPYTCEICTKGFNRRDHLNQHMRLHDRHNDHTCDICQMPYYRADHLAKHRASKHGIGEKIMGEKKYFCDVCHKGFTTEKYRDVHMKAHNGDKKYTCRTCEKTFLNKSHLTEHMKFHNEHAKKFLCSECGQRFIRNDYLVIHMRRHRGEKPFKCKFCGKGFPRTTDLTVHERYHTGEKTHLCTVCGRGFGRAYNLTVHMRTHTGEKPYQCTYCDAAFAQGNDLKAHVRRHTGERFQCELCSESFLMGYLLTQHKRTVHGIEGKPPKKIIPIVSAAPPPLQVQTKRGLNVVSNIRRLQPVNKHESPDDPPPITIPLPKPVVPETLMFNHIQAQLAVAQMHLARE